MKCPNCNKNQANKDYTFGVMPCDECTNRMRKGSKKLGGWLSNQHLEEYAATPFWRHMGLEPKPHELAQEKKMKWQGKTYADLQKERNSGKNARFNNDKLVKSILAGKPPEHKPLSYAKGSYAKQDR